MDRREGESQQLESPFIFQRYRVWLLCFFTKLIECSPPLRTVRQLPVKLSSDERTGASTAIPDNIKSTPIWQNSRSRNGTNQVYSASRRSPIHSPFHPLVRSYLHDIPSIAFFHPVMVAPLIFLTYPFLFITVAWNGDAYAQMCVCVRVLSSCERVSSSCDHAPITPADIQRARNRNNAPCFSRETVVATPFVNLAFTRVT